MGIADREKEQLAELNVYVYMETLLLGYTNGEQSNLPVKRTKNELVSCPTITFFFVIVFVFVF